MHFQYTYKTLLFSSCLLFCERCPNFQREIFSKLGDFALVSQISDFYAFKNGNLSNS